MFKFLHAADLHLDSPLRGLERYEGCPVDEVRKSSRRAMENLVALAIEEQVAFVLIAGDVFDGDLPDYGACLFLNEQLVKLADVGIRTFMIQGNHDAASVQKKYLKLPDNVYQFSTEAAETVAIDEIDVRIHGRGFATRAVTENLAISYPGAEQGAFSIGLLHTCLTGREGHESYAPCTIDDLRAKEYGYWALGHVHTHEVLWNDPPIVFAGNLQGRHIRESGPKGAVIVEVNGGQVTGMQHRSLDVMRWERASINASGASTEDDLIDRVRDELATLLSQGNGLPIAIRLEIQGACAAHDRLADRVNRLTGEIRAQARDVGSGRLWIEKVVLRTRPENDPDGADPSIHVLLDHLDKIRKDPLRIAALGGELADLKRKLPTGWADSAGRLEIDAPERILAVLENLGSELINALTSDGGAA